MEHQLAEKVKCPICLQVPPREVYQCSNGHTICFDCSTRVAECPTCRVKYAANKIRNRALEDILDIMTFECEFKELGCNTKTQRANISSHLNSCKFGGTKVNLCHLLGYQCDYITWARNIPEAGLHLITSHHTTICDENNIEIQLHGPFDSYYNPGPKLSWSPVIMKDYNGSRSSVLIKIGFNDADKSLFITCVKLLDDAQKSEAQNNYTLEFVVLSADCNVTQNIIWSTEPFELKYASKALQNQLFRIPYDFLQNYVKNGIVTIACNIVRKGNQNAENRVQSKVVILPNTSAPSVFDIETRPQNTPIIFGVPPGVLFRNTSQSEALPNLMGNSTHERTAPGFPQFRISNSGGFNSTFGNNI